MERFTYDDWSNKKASPETLKKLADMMKDINAKISEAETFAKEHGLSFSCNFGYGGGASFGPHSVTGADWQGVEYDESDIAIDEYGDKCIHYWYTSTQSCM
jgi:hypothetical protein